MIGLNEEFEAVLDTEATKRGFIKGSRELNSTPIYSTSEWLIGAGIKVGFPDISVRILFTPQNPPSEESKQRLIACDALWCSKREKWLMQDQEYTSKELILLAFDQLEHHKNNLY